jgi:DNA-binding PadR family transcriptional regulator
MNQIDAIILGRLYDRPNWAKSLCRVKPRLTALVNAGYVERIAPPGNNLSSGRGRNMVALTPKGVDLIENYWHEKHGANPT